MRVLVVEDEYYARKSLVKEIERLGAGFTVEGDYETGRDALAHVMEHEVDLIITDIRMPVMDGIELSRRVYEQFPDIKIIIVSGYADFAYAQKAISYHVKNYLIKPIKEHELREALASIQMEISKEQQNIEKIAEQKFMDSTLNHLTMKEVLQNEYLIRRTFGSGAEFSKSAWVMINLQSQDKTGEAELENAVRGLFTALFPAVSVLSFRRNCETIIVLYGEENVLRSNTYVNRMNIWMGSMAGEGIRLTAGKSRICHSFAELKQAYRDCIEAINNRLIIGRNQLYEYAEPSGKRTEDVVSRVSEIILTDSIADFDFTAAQKEINKIFSDLKARKITVRDLEVLMFKFYEIINRIYVERGKYDFSIQENISYLYSSLSAFYNLDELRTHILDAVRQACAENQNKVDYEIVKKLIEYVENNYMYEISLNELAVQRFFMNASYLSRLFKGQTGKNFSRYLIEYRIEKAKELLNDTSLKISDIAMHVGFNTTSHFGQTFKKIVGETPEQFRRR